MNREKNTNTQRKQTTDSSEVTNTSTLFLQCLFVVGIDTDTTDENRKIISHLCAYKYIFD